MAGKTVTWKPQGASVDGPFLHVEMADTFLRRFLGLMGRKSISPGYGLFLYPCSSVHMCFMRFPIDVVYMKHFHGDGYGAWKVVKVVQGLCPWIGISACMKADAVLELNKGEAKKIGLELGTVWEYSPLN